ncbi:MAG: hypothetical protein J1F27_07455, partial [Prevotellaceae bacterium]|nr:hypothetical protein [Prevotellaceae bacterium]
SVSKTSFRGKISHETTSSKEDGHIEIKKMCMSFSRERSYREIKNMPRQRINSRKCSITRKISKIDMQSPKKIVSLRREIK